MRKSLSGKSKNPGDNASLAIDRYTPVQVGGDKADQRAILEQLAEVTPSKVYEARYEAWKKALASLPDMLILDLQLLSPMAVGLGNETVLENGLAFNRIYGMPMIPGSSLKGLLRRAAAEAFGIRIEDSQWNPADDDETAREKLGDQYSESVERWRALFGSPDAVAGLVVFDAWLNPKGEKPFRVDVLTPHHSDYMMGRQKLPLDSDQPNPVQFLSVRPKSVFTFAIQLPNESWREPMQKILLFALGELGVGAKTNSGYGYFSKREWEDPAPAKAAAKKNPEPLTETLPDGTHEREATLKGKVKARKANAEWNGQTFQVEGFFATHDFPQGTRVIAKLKVERGRIAKAIFVGLADDSR